MEKAIEKISNKYKLPKGLLTVLSFRYLTNADQDIAHLDLIDFIEINLEWDGFITRWA